MVARRSPPSWHLPPAAEACSLCREGLVDLDPRRTAVAAEVALALLSGFSVKAQVAPVMACLEREFAPRRLDLLTPHGAGRWRVAASSDRASFNDVVVDQELYPELVAVTNTGSPFVALDVESSEELAPRLELLRRAGIRSLVAFPLLVLPDLPEPIVLKITFSRVLATDDSTTAAVLAHLLAHSLATLNPASLARDLELRDRPNSVPSHAHLLRLLPLPAIVVDGEGEILELNASADHILAPDSAQLFRTRPAGSWMSARQWSGEIILGAESRPVLGWTTGIDAGRSLVIFDLHPDIRYQKREDILRRALTEKVTELERVNERLHGHSLLQSRFVTDAAHELKTPLAIIRSYLETLMVDLSDGLTDDQRTFIQRARDGALRLQILVDELLDLAALEQGYVRLSFTPVGLDDAVDTVIGELAPLARMHGVAVSRGGSSVHVRADRDRLLQVVRNLLENAIKYTPSGRKIHLVTSSRSDQGILEVLDQGIGIDVTLLPQVFDPFFRVPGNEEEAGAGLGLAITRRFVTAMGGRISVDSQVGQGSSFTVELPLWAKR